MTDHSNKGKEPERAPPPYSDEPYDPLDNDYGPLPAGAEKKREKEKAPADDEPFDPLDNEYGPPPPGFVQERKKRDPGNDEPFDPLDNEYDPLPESVVAEQRARASTRRESFRRMADMVRRESFNAFNQRREDSAEEPQNDESYDPLGCDYPSGGCKATVNRTGAVDVYVDLSPGEPPATESVDEDIDPFYEACPPLNIVIFIVGSRGDVQPYLALALELIKARGHRVRIATHAAFYQLVTDTSANLAGLTDTSGVPLTSKLEFFDIGGDPQELMSYMVRNPGLLPGMTSLANGDITKKRAMVRVMLMGCYRACFCPNETTGKLFAADAIISNPPAFAHIHVAEALGIPLVMSFTMPWTPTTAFPHPLVKAKSNRSEESVNNYSSFVLADALMWQGLGDLINTFRFGILGVRPLDLTAGPRVLDRLRIPVTYAWSPSLLSKPKDWRANIDVVGFYSMPKKDGPVKVDQALLDFLKDGKPPIYIGFGSIVVKDPEALTETIFSAIEKTGVRAIISPGWADIGGSRDEIPSNIFIAKGDLPHDWLFADGRVAAVCHHGGAGTTAAGLRQGVPTIIVPFFGDQWFWGSAVANAGAGPTPIPHTKLTTDNLTEAIQFALLPETLEAAQTVGQNIREENGTKSGMESFHKHIPLLNMRCQIDESRVALWWCEKFAIRLSGAAASVLVAEKLIQWNDLRPHRPASYEATRHYTDPIGAFGQAFVNLGAQAVTGTSQLFYAPTRGLSNIFFSLPKASFDVVSSFQEGLDNVPGMMGSPMRRRSAVTNFKSGMNEGVRGLTYGIWDGFTGLVTEPYNGARKGGVTGFLNGSVKSLVNLVARPAGGALGLVVQPATGAYRGVRSRLSGTGLVSSDSVLRGPREAQSHAEAAALSQDEHRAIVASWGKLKAPDLVKARRKAENKRLDALEASLLKIDLSSWPLSEGLVERLSTKGRNSFMAELEAANEEPEPEVVVTDADGKQHLVSPPVMAIPADPGSGSGSASDPSGSSANPRIDVQDISPGSTSPTTSISRPQSTASTADIALAGTDRWEWSRPSSRASMASYSASRWANELAAARAGP